MKKVIFFVIILIIIAFAGYFFVSINAKQNNITQNFFIEKGDGAKEISDKLKERGIIKNPISFRLYALLSGKGKKFYPGDHVLASNLSTIEVVEKLIDKNNINKERQITILEGWSIKDIAKYLDEQEIVSKDEFMLAADIGKWRYKYDFLNDKKIKSLEGYLFPDTYRIFIDSDSEQIIEKLLDNFEAKVTDQMRVDASAKGLGQIITMASIIEKEARFKQDKKMISDVFWKRIEIGMALQSDATINYLTEKGQTRSSGADLEIDSPYNTYKYRGLPPGPIANPGIDAINAAIYPQSNEYYYFITDNAGKAVYAKTFDEHKANIAKYLD